LSFVGIIAGLQQLAGRKMQPCRAANAQPLGGGIDAGENLCVEAQADRGNARVVVLQCGSGLHESCWHDALGWPRCSAVLSLIQFRNPALDEGDEVMVAGSPDGPSKVSEICVGPLVSEFRESLSLSVQLRGITLEITGSCQAPVS
jgi:hypothetical protein